MASISDLNYLATITAYQAGLSPSKLPQGWVVVATTDSLVRDRVLNPADVKDGYYGVVVRNVETNEYVVVNRGTANGENLGSYPGIATNTVGISIKSGYEQSSDEFAKAALGQILDPKNDMPVPTSITFDGHSLGYSGAQSQIQTIDPIGVGLNGIPVNAVGFNGSGVSSNDVPGGSLGNRSINFMVPGDPVCWRRLKFDPPCRLNIDPGGTAVV